MPTGDAVMTYDDDFRLSFLRRSAPVCFRSRKVGQYVIDLCKYHRLPAEVQFLSLEIFSVLCCGFYPAIVIFRSGFRIDAPKDVIALA